MHVFIVESPLVFHFHLSHSTNLNFISSQKLFNRVAKKLWDQESEDNLVECQQTTVQILLSIK